MAVVVGAVVMGSIWSGQAYENVTTGAYARAFIANARLALTDAPTGTVVVDGPVPNGLELTTFGASAYASVLIGDMAPNEPASKLRWTRAPVGTIDKLYAFGADGRLHQAAMFGVYSKPRAAHEACWPRRDGRISILFNNPTPTGTKVVRFGYLLYSPVPKVVTVQYGATFSSVEVEPGLHSAYLTESGSVSSLVIGGFGKVHLCVGDAEAGVVVASGTGPTIPAAVIP